MQARFDRVVGRVVFCARRRPAEGQVNHNALIPGSSEDALSIGMHPLDARDDIARLSTPVLVQDLHRHNTCFLGHPVLARGDGPCNVRAMTVEIAVALFGDERLAPLGASLELVVRGEDTGVDDVHGDTCTTGRGICVVHEPARELHPVVNAGKSLCDIGSISYPSMNYVGE